MNQKLYNPKFKEKKTAAEKKKNHCGHTGFGFSGNLLDDAEDRFA